jgi:hypothetical protein
MTGTGLFRRLPTRSTAGCGVAVIVAVIVLNGIFEEVLVLAAELMMLIRWTRDVLRYDLRWVVREKVRAQSRRRDR